jgi:hypothetical protein
MLQWKCPKGARKTSTRQFQPQGERADKTMMNSRERRDMEELRDYYNKIQKAIEQIQQKMNNIDLAEARKKGNETLIASAAAFAAYKDCLNILFFN